MGIGGDYIPLVVPSLLAGGEPCLDRLRWTWNSLNELALNFDGYWEVRRDGNLDGAYPSFSQRRFNSPIIVPFGNDEPLIRFDWECASHTTHYTPLHDLNV